MMLLVHQSPKSLAPHRHPNLGVLCSPRCVYGDDIQTWPWAADNDAYSKWDEGRYRDMLERIRPRTGCLFVTAPDVVGDAAQTLYRFRAWRDILGDLPVALVAQDGLERYGVPWDEISALFIGGTTGFKMSESAGHLVREAKDRGKWVHMGRVNSHRRLRYAKALGCDSIDGTQLSWFRDAKLPQFLAHAEQGAQMMLGTT